MAWSGSTRRDRLPADWKQRRRLVLERDGHSCRHCGAQATDVDHVRAGDDHSLGNLQALCRACHRRKTAAEKPRERRPGESHPGLI